MSFLDNNSSEYLSARITQEGRRAIAKGDFNISYFVVGDSEYDYTNPFSGLTGNTQHQGVFSPLDKDSYVKYPLKYNDSGTIYGLPVSFNQTSTIRNSIGPAGFIYDKTVFSGATNTFDVKGVTGSTNTISVTLSSQNSGHTYANCDYITLTFDSLTGASNNVLGKKINSLVYKIENVTTTGLTETLTLDRNLPDFSGLISTGISGHVICNKCEVEYESSDVDNTCIPLPPNNTDQHNPWKLNIVYGKKPIGLADGGNLRSLSGYTSNKYIGTKEFLGYNSTGQTYVDNLGGTITGATSYVNTYGEKIILDSTKQRSVAIVHFSEVGDIVNDQDRFFRYDDYISTEQTILPENTVTDQDYFEVYIPFLLYHRQNTVGAKFKMGGDDKFMASLITSSNIVRYRDLLDEGGVAVGKIFVDKKTIVFDDPEIVTALDYKSNRKYTLPAPKVSLKPITGTTSVLADDSVKIYLTYLFEYTGNTALNNLPCSYISEITGTTSFKSDVTISFNSSDFIFMKSQQLQFNEGFIANKFYVLAQTGTTTGITSNTNWKKIDFTIEAGGDGSSILDPANIKGKTFTLNYTKYTGGTTFDLTTHYSGMTYTGDTGSYFGDEQPFPGSVKVVRASDIEEMNFMVNLPSNVFSTSQNPTYSSQQSPMVTEIALLNSSKKTMVMAKTSQPIKRVGTQVFAVKLDF